MNHVVIQTITSLLHLSNEVLEHVEAIRTPRELSPSLAERLEVEVAQLRGALLTALLNEQVSLLMASHSQTSSASPRRMRRWVDKRKRSTH